MEQRTSTTQDAITNRRRLHALQSLGPLDQLELSTASRFIRLASRMLNAPASLVSLVEADQQIFLSSLGLPEPWASRGKTPLSHSFCQYVVASQQPFVVSDARTHPLVADNLAIHDLNVISYAGVPLQVAPGIVLGALCVIDSVPREWTPDEVALLEDLAMGVVADLSQRATSHYQAQAEAQLAVLFDHAQDAIWSVDRDGNLIACNMAFTERIQSIFQVLPLLGECLLERMPQEVRVSWQAHYDRALTGERVIVEQTYTVDGEIRSYEDALSPITLAGAITGVTVVSRDCTARRQAEAALHRQTELYESLLRAQNDLGEAVMISEGDRLLYVNDAYTRVTGFAREEALSLASFVEHLTPDAQVLYRERQARFARGEAVPPHYETAIFHKDGHRVDLDAAVIAVQVDGRPRRVVIVRDISARKRAEKELRLRDRALAASRNGVLITDLYQEGNPVIYCNPAFTELTGYSADEVLGRNCHFLQGPDTDPKAIAQIRAAIAAEQPCRVTLLNYRKDGTTFWNDLTLAPVRDDNGRLTHLVGVQTDITARVEAAAALQRSEARFALAFHANPAAMVISTVAEGRYVDVNDSFAQLIGYTREEIVGRTAHDLQVWADPGDRMQLIEMLRADGRVRNLEARFYTKSGIMRTALASVERIEVGSEACLLTLIDDVTERRGAEQALRKSEARFRHLAQNSPDCIYLVDVPSQEVLYGNRETFLGYTLNQLRDRATILQSVHPEDQAAVDTHWQQVLTACTDALPMVDYRFRTADGAWEWLQQRTAIIARSQENQPAQLLITIGVITAQKRAEEERVALERTLQETQKLESLGVLAGGIAHDFNNLLVAVLGNAEIALMDLDRDHPAYTSVEHIQLAGQRAAELTGQMLAYAGKGRFVVAPLSLNTLVQELKPLLRTSTPKLVDLTYDLAPNLPFIDGDATQIRQILMNLVINGAEAMEGRAGRVTVTTGLRRVDLVEVGNFHLAVDLAPGTYVALSVADTGCGIDVATQSRIFDPFFTTKFTGRGLGLATVLGIVRAHGGAIQIDSVVGHGTQMTVLLPQGATQGENPKDDSGTQVAEQSRPQHQTVLVIDDEADVRTVTARVLERLGYKVLLASDGVMGAELFAQHSNQVSAVLLDLTMPKLSAEETVTRLHATSTTVPIVVISGYSAQDVVNRFAPGVIAGVLQKPFKPQQLAQTLKQVVVAPRTDRG